MWWPRCWARRSPRRSCPFGAHYDSVDFSKGVYDNGAGSVINMEILRYFKENPPKRTLKFMWYGSEEIGLEGSWAYVKAHKEELANHLLMINVDVGGPVLGVDKITATAEQKLADYLDYFVKIHGFGAETKQGIYSSDSIPFADCGVPGVNFSRDGAQGAAYIHNRFDTLSFLSARRWKRPPGSCWPLAGRWPTPRCCRWSGRSPQNIVEDVEKYLYKKELSEGRYVTIEDRKNPYPFPRAGCVGAACACAACACAACACAACACAACPAH